MTISLLATRTSLGEKVGVTYPVYWSEGDKISANGVESSEARIDENNPSRAQFSFPSVVNYPLNILYPSGSKVTFAAEQHSIGIDLHCAAFVNNTESLESEYAHALNMMTEQKLRLPYRGTCRTFLQDPDHG